MALPVDEILTEIRIEKDPRKAMRHIVESGRNLLASEIWDAFEEMDMERDIRAAQHWLEDNLDQLPDFTGIYFGLDTLNMDEGDGSNLEIGLSHSCDPGVLSDEWVYECEYYGESHLIKGLFEVSDCFSNEEKWGDEVVNFAEYTIFLGYSGLILRETLNRLEIKNNFISVWGFHDGDTFFLMQKVGKRSLTPAAI